ncbi:MAG: hypothetical protein U9N50_02005 [Pseudomonadota bacterium]|nr:hypothetical protein [Pseudomonadota bacterium]
MGLLSFLRDKKTAQLSQSTVSGVGKDLFDDWAAMTEEQGGHYSALTMSKNVHGVGLTFRCRTRDMQKMISLCISEKADKYFFELGKKYKVRLQFENSIVIYAYMRAYKQRHATIVDIMDEFIHNIFDSDKLKLQYLGDNGKKITMKFSLKGSTPAINSTIARTRQQKEKINS